MKDLRIKDIAERYGMTRRYWTDRASRGEIPGTRRHQCGKRWIYFIDAEAFERWIATQRIEVTPCQQSSADGSTGARARTGRKPAYGGGASAGKAKSSTDPSIRKLRALLASA